MSEQRHGLAEDLSTIRRLAPLFALLTRRHRVLLAFAVATAILHQVFVLASGIISAWLVSMAFSGAPVESLRNGLIALVIIVPFAALSPLVESYLAHVAAFEILAIMRSRVFEAFERLAPAYLLTKRTGDLGATITDDVEQLELFYAHTLSPLIVSCTTPFIGIVVLGFFHWSLSLVLLITIALLIWVSSYSRQGALTQGIELRAATGELSAQASGAIQGLRELLTFGAGDIQKNHVAEADTRLHLAKTAHVQRSSNERSIADALTVVGVMGILLTSAWLVVNGQLSATWSPVATIIAMTSLMPVFDVAAVVRDLNLVAASAARIDEVLQAEPKVTELATSSLAETITPSVEFDHVDFHYEEGEGTTVHDVTFTINPGETVAIVGRSGVGKSTCVHLLMRLWDVNAGAIRVGGYDIREFPLEQLRDVVTVLPQDAYIFATSIKENIRVSYPQASDEEVQQAAKAALADEFISSLPEGYDTIPGERGASLSGGQRQRIALARALLKNPPILVLDEAVSNLDTISESEVNAALMDARKEQTTVIIAHRLSTIRQADRIIVLSNGTVSQIGNHNELVNVPGEYQELVKSQLLSHSTEE